MSSNNNNGSSSTVKSYVDQAVGTAQSAIGSVTGNNQNKEQGGATKKQAETEHNASGLFTADPNTGTTKSDSGRSGGSWNQTVGSAKESIGNLIGNENLRQEGIRQNAEGKSQEAKGQVQDFSEGITKRVQGTLGSVGAAITGDRESEARWRDVQDEGKAKHRDAEADILKRQQQQQQQPQ